MNRFGPLEQDVPPVQKMPMMFANIRGVDCGIYSKEVADNVRIQYGGSVKADKY